MRERGRVKKFVEERGFGFIKSDAGDDVFVRISQVDGSNHLEAGDEVEFDRGTNPKTGRECATAVTLV